MIQQLTEMMEEVLYDIFLDIHKAYCAVYRGRCLEIIFVEHSTEAYALQMTGGWSTHQERLCMLVNCLGCDADLVAGSLATHNQVQHRVGQGDLCKTLCHPPPGEPWTYRMSFPPKAYDMTCPVEGCTGRSLNHTDFRLCFVHCHVQDTIVVLEEVNLPLPQCPQYDMFVSWEALKWRHLDRVMCAKGSERNFRWWVE